MDFLNAIVLVAAMSGNGQLTTMALNETATVRQAQDEAAEKEKAKKEKIKEDKEKHKRIKDKFKNFSSFS